MVKKVEAVIFDDRRSTMERVMVEIGLSPGTACMNIHEKLHVNVVSASWLTPRYNFSQKNLVPLERNHPWSPPSS